MVELGNGLVAIVDEEDFDRISQYKWSAVKDRGRVYAGRREAGSHILMHREILRLVTGDGKQVDHINHVCIDNRKSNLRIVTHRENARNRVKHKGSSVYKGVSFCKDSGVWRAHIKIDQVGLSIGSFRDEYDAACAYDAAASWFFGEHAKLNFYSVPTE